MCPRLEPLQYFEVACCRGRANVAVARVLCILRVSTAQNVHQIRATAAFRSRPAIKLNENQPFLLGMYVGKRKRGCGLSGVHIDGYDAAGGESKAKFAVARIWGTSGITHVIKHEENQAFQYGARLGKSECGCGPSAVHILLMEVAECAPD